MVAETAGARIGRLRRLDPVLRAFVDADLVSDREADDLLVMGELDRLRRPARTATPVEASRLASCLAVYIAVRAILERRHCGPVALVGGTNTRRLLAQLTVEGVEIAPAMQAVRLRADGLGQPLGPGPVRQLRPDDRLVLITPRIITEKPAVRFATLVVDRTTLGHNSDDHVNWAEQAGDVVHTIGRLDPQETPNGLDVDWPSIAAAGDNSLDQSWPLTGNIQLVEVGTAPDGLHEARLAIRHAPRHRPWPPQLLNAASISRSLASLAVPPSTYDAHLRGGFTPSLADRVEQLEQDRARRLPTEWRAFADTRWASLRTELLRAYSNLTARNLKAEQIGLTTERLLREGHRVDIWTDTRTHAQALETHLLTAGFGVTPDDFDEGRLTIGHFTEATGAHPNGDCSLLTGLPAPWHLAPFISAEIARPVSVLTYDFETERAGRLVGWALNGQRLERARARTDSIRAALGDIETTTAPDPIELTISVERIAADDPRRSLEIGEDAAEFAALADDEWLALIAQEAEDATGAGQTATVRAVAYLVDEASPRVLILAAGGLVDRLSAHQVSPAAATDLAPGMRVLVGAGGENLFASLRPALERRRGPISRFWMTRWQHAFSVAAGRADSADELAKRLVTRGAQITPQAVASWVSPYRVGPRDWNNVRRVGDLADDRTVTEHAHRIGTVMQGIRVEHSRIGRRIAAALIRSSADQSAMLDQLEDELGVDLSQFVSSVEQVTVHQSLGFGTAQRQHVGRLWTVREAQRLFVPNITEDCRE